jgi:hypothetical protein
VRERVGTGAKAHCLTDIKRTPAERRRG